MNVLVVGGAGYIGSHCVRQLQAAGHRPVVLDNLVYGHRAAVAAGVPLHVFDMSETDRVKAVLRAESIDLVMHFAAYCYVGESVQAPIKYYANNLIATLHLLQAMVEEKVTRFVFSSTCATYGIPAALPIREDMPQSPINPYGQTKLAVERALCDYAKAYGLSFAAFRYFNAAGADPSAEIGEDHDPETHLIPLAIEVALGERDHLRVFGTDYPTPDGTCLRDYVHVNDLAQAHIAAFTRLDAPGQAAFYNLGTGTPYSVLDVLGAVEQVSGKSVKWLQSPRREGDPPALYADAGKARAELGWQPHFDTLGSIVETAWRWHSTRPHGFS